jgi:hypothetical protein
MINADVNSNAQSWELEVICKNKQYLNAVVEAILKYGVINFEVEVVDFSAWEDGEWDGRYTILMWAAWFSALKRISKDLAKIEKKFDNL